MIKVKAVLQVSTEVVMIETWKLYLLVGGAFAYGLYFASCVMTGGYGLMPMLFG